MARSIKKLPSFTNVAVAATATLDLPLGLTYDRIVLIQGGTTFTRAQMGNITLEANGKPIQYFKDGVRLEAVNMYYNRANTVNYNSIWLNRREFVDLQQRRACGLGTADLQTLQLKVDILAGASAPTLQAYAIQSPQQPMGLICKVKEFSFNGLAGVWEIDNIPKGPRIMALHINKTDLTNIEVELDSRRITDATKALLDALAKEAGRVPQANYSVVDYCLDEDIYQALATANTRDLRVRPTTTTGGATPVLVEYLDGFAGI